MKNGQKLLSVPARSVIDTKEGNSYRDQLITVIYCDGCLACMVLVLVMLILVVIQQAAPLVALLALGKPGVLSVILVMVFVAWPLDVDGFESAIQSVTSGLSIHFLICKIPEIVKAEDELR